MQLTLKISRRKKLHIDLRYLANVLEIWSKFELHETNEMFMLWP